MENEGEAERIYHAEASGFVEMERLWGLGTLLHGEPVEVLFPASPALLCCLPVSSSSMVKTISLGSSSKRVLNGYAVDWSWRGRLTGVDDEAPTPAPMGDTAGREENGMGDPLSFLLESIDSIETYFNGNGLCANGEKPSGLKADPTLLLSAPLLLLPAKSDRLMFL